MQYENERFIVFYNHNDENIQQLIATLESKFKEIMNFFGLENISRKVIVKIYYLIDDYKKHLIPYLEEMGEIYHDWMIADTMDDNINMLELNLCRELSSHRNETIEDQMQNILHEFAPRLFEETKAFYNQNEMKKK